MPVPDRWDTWRMTGHWICWHCELMWPSYDALMAHLDQELKKLIATYEAARVFQTKKRR